MISQDRLKELLTYVPETGVFYWNKGTGSRCWIGKTAGSTRRNHHTNYKSIGIDKRVYSAHRLAFLYMTGSIPDIVDHINGVGTDNRWSNLRAVSKKENSKNKKPYRIKAGVTRRYENSRAEIASISYGGMGMQKEFKELGTDKYAKYFR